MKGMMISSMSLSAFSCEASLVKTGTISRRPTKGCSGLTQARCEYHNIDIGDELLRFRIKHPLTSHDIAWKCHKDDLKDSFKDEQSQVREVRV